MPDTKISGYAVATAPTGTELVEVVQGGTNKQTTVLGFKTGLGLVKADVGLGSVDNTTDAGKPVSTATQTALDLKAALAGPTFTGVPAAPTAAAATSTTQLATTAFATTADNLKANIASPTFTGTVGGVTSAMVGLGNANNTSDAAKPVSTATQTAIDLKANLAGPTFTGVPAAPTAAVSTNTTQLATCAFVLANAGSPAIPWSPTLDSATTATVLSPIKLVRTSSGAPANGIGTGLEFETETTAGNNEIGAVIESVTLDVTAASEDFALVFKTQVAGSTTLVEGMRLIGERARFATGTAGAPSVTLDSASDQGFYGTGAFGVGFTMSGTARLVLNTHIHIADTSSIGWSPAGSIGIRETYFERVAAGTIRAGYTTGSGVSALLQRTLVDPHTGNATLVANDSGGLRTNAGAAGAVTLTLPAAVLGLRFEFAVIAVQNLIIDAAGTDLIRIGASVSTAGGTATNGAQGSTISLKCVVAGSWYAISAPQGTWTLA